MFFLLGESCLLRIFTGEIETDTFKVEDKEYLPGSRKTSQSFIITEDKEFKVRKKDYKNIEKGDIVVISYNSKTFTVRNVENASS